MEPNPATANSTSSDPNTTWVHVNPWFSVGLSDGYYRIEPAQAQVVVLPCIGRDILFVRVHRPLLGMALLELPAGCAEPGESPVEAIRRELAEEAGVFVQDLSRFQELPPLTVSPDRIPRWPSLFQIEISEEEFACRQDHDDEIDEVLRLDKATIFERILNGGLQSCLPMAILFRHFCQTLGDPGGNR